MTSPSAPTTALRAVALPRFAGEDFVSLRRTDARASSLALEERGGAGPAEGRWRGRPLRRAGPVSQ